MAEHKITIPIGVEGYVIYGCHCPVCKDAYYALGATPRERRRKSPFKPPHVHGTWNGYSNWACPCDLCLSACRKTTSEYGQAWRQANREKRRVQRLRKSREGK